MGSPRMLLIVALLVIAGCASPEPPPVDRGAASDLGSSRAADQRAPDTGHEASEGKAAPPAACAGLAVPVQRDYKLELDAGGKKRLALVHVPPGYDASKPVPLLLALHGNMLSASAQQKMSRLDEEADARGAIVVYPEGTGGAYAGWNAGPSPLGHLYKDVDDVAFIAALLDRLAKSLCVDPKRVLCTGFSLGGSMCYRIACELSERVAAIAPVAGPDVAPACSPKRALPLLAFWGTADGFAAYAGDPGTQPNNKGAVKTVGDYAKRAGCEAASKPTTSKGAVSCETWGGCKDGAEATLCTVKGGGHTWPGGEPWALFGGLVTGGAINKDVSASLLILDFFYKHAP